MTLRSYFYPLCISTGSVIRSPETGQSKWSGMMSYSWVCYPSRDLISFTFSKSGLPIFLSCLGTFWQFQACLKSSAFTSGLPGQHLGQPLCCSSLSDTGPYGRYGRQLSLLRLRSLAALVAALLSRISRLLLWFFHCGLGVVSLLPRSTPIHVKDLL